MNMLSRTVDRNLFTNPAVSIAQVEYRDDVEFLRKYLPKKWWGILKARYLDDMPVEEMARSLKLRGPHAARLIQSGILTAKLLMARKERMAGKTYLEKRVISLLKAHGDMTIGELKGRLNTTLRKLLPSLGALEASGNVYSREVKGARRWSLAGCYRC